MANSVHTADSQMLDETIRQSFPASDAPSSNRATGRETPASDPNRLPPKFIAPSPHHVDDEAEAGVNAPTRPDPAIAYGNEEELGGRPAFLFHNGSSLAVTLDPTGTNLPRMSGNGQWSLDRQFPLGVRDAGVVGINPEALICGVLADGYYVWQTTGSHPTATSQ